MITYRAVMGGAIVGIAGVLLGASFAQAGLVLTLDDLGTAGIDVIVVDNADGGIGTLTAKGISNFADSSGVDGAVMFNGAVGSFVVNVSTGVSKPLIGPRKIDLNSVNVSGAAGELEIMLTDTDFMWDGGAPSQSWLTGAIGGTTTGTVEANGFVDLANTEFGMGIALGTSTFSGGAFSGTDFQSFSPVNDDPFSLTAVTRITHGGAGAISSFDYIVSVPEPAALGTLGVGLIGLGFAARRRRRQAA